MSMKYVLIFLAFGSLRQALIVYSGIPLAVTTIGGVHKHEKVPVWCSIVLRFGDSEPVLTDAATAESGPDSRPDLSEITLRFVWQCSIVFPVFSDAATGQRSPFVHP